MLLRLTQHSFIYESVTLRTYFVVRAIRLDHEAVNTSDLCQFISDDTA
jgi:hypothetical protein